MRNLTRFFLASSLLLTFAGCDTEGDGPTVVELRAKPKIACGGFTGMTCPEKMTCVDDPFDECDPELGGADCIGMCVNGNGQGKNMGHGMGGNGKSAGNSTDSCDNSDQSKTYVGESPEECALIFFVCAEGSEYFADDCGCGCQLI